MTTTAVLFDLDGTLVKAILREADRDVSNERSAALWVLLATRRARALRRGSVVWRSRARAAGAYRVYEDPLDLLRHLDEFRVRTG